MDGGDPDVDMVKYSSNFHEGEKLQLGGAYDKAILCYTAAVDAITPNGIMNMLEGRECLTKRSQCYLLLGDHAAAYEDAEESLKVGVEGTLEAGQEFIPGLLAKAEALYAKGEFEFALIFYHRGSDLRPELEPFKLGISKAVEAIENSIGTPTSCALDTTGDLTLFHQNPAPELNTTSKPVRKTRTVKVKAPPKASDKTVKQLLGELYADKRYLQELMEDPTFVFTAPVTTDDDDEKPKDVRTLIGTGLNYLDTRSQFWRQQNPIYARVNAKKALSVKSSTLSNANGGHRSKNDAAKVLQRLEVVESLLDDGEYDRAHMLANGLISTVDDLHGISRRDKLDLAARVNSSLGNALLELGKLDDAMDAHLNDYRYCEEVADKADLQQALARARGNLGRVHARSGDYNKAIEIWKERGPTELPVENAWLYHEIGRSYVEMDDFHSALEVGQESLNYAKESEDHQWIMNAAVLVAQSQIKCEMYEAALSSFSEALHAAKMLSDTASEISLETAITKTMPLAALEKNGGDDPAPLTETMPADQVYDEPAAAEEEPATAEEEPATAEEEPATAEEEPAAAEEEPAAAEEEPAAAEEEPAAAEEEVVDEGPVEDATE